MFLTHAENQRATGHGEFVRAFTAVEIESDKTFFVCTRLQFVGRQWRRTTALLIFEDDVREILKEKKSKLVELMMVEPIGNGWKTRNVIYFWDVYSNELKKWILVFADENGHVATLWPAAAAPSVGKRPTWSKQRQLVSFSTK